MDTLSAWARAESARARGEKSKVFDWVKAAKLIKERGAKTANAGLSGDWEYTGGCIFSDGKPDLESYTYLASIWATPELELDDDYNYMDCWIYAEDSPGWDAGTKWPKEALDILAE